MVFRIILFFIALLLFGCAAIDYHCTGTLKDGKIQVNYTKKF
jgi:hypothetical protein